MGILGDIVGGIKGGIEDVGHAIGGLVSNPYVDAAALAAFGIYDPGAFAGILGSTAETATAAEAAGAGLGVGADIGAVGGSGIIGALESGMGALGISNAGSILQSMGSLGSSLGSLLPTGGPAGTAASSGIGTMGSIFDVGKGVYGLNLARQMRERTDPFAKYRGGYGERLAQLEANPGSITGLPGYQAGLEATRRAAAAGGYAGSGNELAALAKYGGDFFNQTAQRYAGLAGAGATPGAGDPSAALLASGSLKSVGSGIYGLFGGH